MVEVTKAWLVIGSLENWETALAQPIPIWGLKESYTRSFEFLSKGDQIVIYVISPIKGVVGFALVKDKYRDYETLIWNEEKDARRVVWPLRFRLSDLRVLPRQYWGNTQSGLPSAIDIRDLELFWQRGFQQLTGDQTAKIYERARKNWGETLFAFGVRESGDEYSIEDTGKIVEPTVSLHKKIQGNLVEIGRLQFYYPETEFLLSLETEHRKVDVVWKRELSGVPTFAFEVKLSGGVEEAMTKLRLAFNKWNSQPRLIVPDSHSKSVDSLLVREESSFRRSFRYVPPEVVERLLEKKQDLRSFEERYGIY